MKIPKVIVVIKVLELTEDLKNIDRCYYLTNEYVSFLKKVNIGDLLSFEHPFIYNSDSVKRKGFLIKMTNLNTLQSINIRALYLENLWDRVITDFEQVEL